MTNYFFKYRLWINSSMIWRLLGHEQDCNTFGLGIIWRYQCYCYILFSISWIEWAHVWCGNNIAGWDINFIFHGLRWSAAWCKALRWSEAWGQGSSVSVAVDQLNIILDLRNSNKRKLLVATNVDSWFGIENHPILE